MYYSFNAGPAVHFTMTCTESPLDVPDINATVKAWMAADLASASKNRSAGSNAWIIVGGHRPFYCTNGGTQCGSFAAVLRAQAESLLLASGVDLVVTAHEHGYERLFPTANGTVTSTNYSDPAAPVYIVQGAGGNREGNEKPSGAAPWSAFQSGTIGFATITIADLDLTYSFLAADGTPIDTFTITKSTVPR